MEGTTIEKKLMSDIYKSNILRGEIEKKLVAVSQWSKRLVKLKNFKGQKKYTASTKRCISNMEQLRAKLNKINDGVDKSIRELGKYSDSDVNEFCSRLEREISEIKTGEGSEGKKVSKKEIMEIKNARTKLAELKGRGKVQEKIEKARKKVSDDIKEVEQTTGKIIKFNRHLRNLSVGATSGSADNEELFYTQELKRIARDRAIYG